MAGITFELERCPHCGSDAQVRDHSVYRYQCMACGNPRIPTERRLITTPPTVTQTLKQVRSHHVQRGVWTAASWMMWLLALLCGLFGAGTAWSLEFGAAGWTFVSILTFIPLLLGVVSRYTASSQRARATAQLEEAWRKIAVHFFSLTPEPRTLDEVKAAFGVDTDSALRLLAEGEVATYLEHEATLGGLAPSPSNRLRIADDEPLAGQLRDLEETTNDSEQAPPVRHK